MQSISRFGLMLTAVGLFVACDTPADPSPTGVDADGVAFAGRSAVSSTSADHALGSRVVASATGSGHRVRNGRPLTFTFHAVRMADGSSRGTYSLDWQELGGGLGRLKVEVDVTCLSVVGNTAWVGGIITKVDGPLAIEGTVSYFYVIDNGEGSGAVDEISALRLNDVAGEDQVFCNERPLVLVRAPIERGNASVRGF